MKKMNALVFLASVFALLLSSCTPTQSEPAVTTTLNLKTEKVLDYTYSSLELEIMKQVNDYRISKNLKALEIVNHISYVADAHDKAMISNKKLTHQFFQERIDNIVKVLGASVVGENLAYNFDTAELVLSRWLLSTEHKANIEGDFTHFGISVKLSAEENRNYCTNIFAKLN